MRRVLSLGESPVGRDVPVLAGVVMAVVALAVTAIEMQMFAWRILGDPWWLRAVPALAAVALFAILVATSGARAQLIEVLGMRLVPVPSVGYWVRSTAVLAGLFGLIVAVAAAVFLAAGGVVTAEAPSADLFGSLVEAPLVEEVIFRWALVTGLAALGPPWVAVIVSGVAFGYAHYLGGVEAANNIAAGFVFAWMYLRSGSILVPIAFHSLGNAAVAVMNVIAYELIR